jgi:hypothetical protein
LFSTVNSIASPSLAPGRTGKTTRRTSEQKNWSIVRRVIGYDRYECAEALAQLNRVYEVLRLWTNHWQPVMKLIGKERVGAKLRKRYDVARTPYHRLARAVTSRFLGDYVWRPSTHG